MIWIGKVVVGGIGLLVAGAPGAVLGAVLGHGLDYGLAQRAARPKPEAEPNGFCSATFAIMGHIAKADGRVSPAEIAVAEAAMARMNLSVDKRRQAIADFTRGKAAGFALEPSVHQVWRDYREHPGSLALFLQLQLQIAHADRTPTPAQQRLLEKIRHGLRVSKPVFTQLEQFIRIHPSGGCTNSRRGKTLTLQQAYAVLGVNARDSDAQIKRAYQRLRGQYHPDRLLAQGLPDEMLQLANDQFLSIRSAYQRIQRARAA